MASGKKNYFRHSFFARNDDFINELIDRFGLAGYYYYFALVEMCGEESSETLQESYTFHRRTLIHSLRLNTRKLNLFLGYLQDKLKISYTITENSYTIIFPNLSKFLGAYRVQIPPKTDKGKERKEKESKENKNKLSVGSQEFKFSIKKERNFAQVVKDWQECFMDSRVVSDVEINKARKFQINHSMNQFPPLRDFGAWRSYFEKIKQSDFLMGGGQKNWVVNFDWAINHENITKFKDGNFNNNSKLGSLEQLLLDNPIMDDFIEV